MYVPLVPGFSYKYEATEDVTGNIEVTESDTWDEKGVRILVVKRAFSKSILDKIVHTLENVNGTTVSRVHLSDTLSKDEKDKIAVGRGCLNADVHITYPRSLRAGVDSPSPNAAAAGLQQLGSLELRTITGEVSIKFKSSSPTSGTPGAYSLDSLNVVVVHGDVDVRRAVVVNKTVIAVVNGQITADLTTPGFVKADMVNGGVGLTISSTPPEGLMIMGKGDGKRVWNPENLDVQANAVNGPVGVTFRNHFHGHFALESKVGSTSFTIPANDRKMTPTNPGSNRIQGWVSEDGQEPLQALPNLVVQTAIGNIKVKVQSRDGS
ncbi:hypothetical protein EC991_011359 [Linnemannia zychae]|nr:hypothetical protein EC991_011359 [Linnemannia zychae]